MTSRRRLSDRHRRNVIQFRGPFVVWVRPDEDGWLVVAKSHGWLHADKRNAIADAEFVAGTFGVAVKAFTFNPEQARLSPRAIHSAANHKPNRREIKMSIKEKTNGTNAVATTNTEADNIISAVREDEFERILKFNKGDYQINKDEPIELGSEFLAHAAAWTKTWIKFADGKIADRKLYRVAHGDVPPEREELGDLDQLAWPAGLDGKPSDPWVYQYLLPLENIESGEILIFVTPSIGGQIAVRELCDKYAKRIKKGQHGQPIIKLATVEMPSKKYGKVPRPAFEIVGWDNTANNPHEISDASIPAEKVAVKHDDMDDGIPF